MTEITESQFTKQISDADRLDFMAAHTHCDFWVHHQDYKPEGKLFSCEGVVMREVIDSAIKWYLKNKT